VRVRLVDDPCAEVGEDVRVGVGAVECQLITTVVLLIALSLLINNLSIFWRRLIWKVTVADFNPLGYRPVRERQIEFISTWRCPPLAGQIPRAIKRTT